VGTSVVSADLTAGLTALAGGVSLCALALPAGSLSGVILVGLSLRAALLVGTGGRRAQARATESGSTAVMLSVANAAIARVLARVLGAAGIDGALELAGVALLSLDRLEGDGRVEVGDVVEETHCGGGVSVDGGVILAGGDGEFNGRSEELSAMQEQDAKAASEGSSQSRRFALHAGVSVDDMDALLILDVIVLIALFFVMTTCMFCQISCYYSPYPVM
jgi:hypothetical protein